MANQDRIEQIIDRAMDMAGERSHEYVTLEHLLLSILQEDYKFIVS